MDRSPKNRQSRSDTVRARAWLLDWLPALVTLGLLSLIAELGLFGSTDSWKLFWSLLNLAPGMWIVRAVVRGLRRADEYQRRCQLEALAIGFGVLITAIYTVGLLQAAGVGDLRQLVQISFLASILIWIAALLFKTSRPR
ncbi:hypothetical protein PUR61_38680 [Streptomyces sp. BE20]|uniref:hypothetical protein n=1 Tax=unclassified Streptomyces TaxID=2593676 RepID=UPI002E777C65|nr:MULTISPECIES: hypothetical protein [unclassified Streptomyces]MED7947565.1 hypothetical protein [Streptomyces sp. BE303]MEE1828063.1 hypothetical protein [Streptomyces sp. BE20]